MTQILAKCPDCGGAGTVPHVPRALLEGEIPNPNDLDQYKTEDACWPCRGGGKRLVDVNVTETPKPTQGEPYYIC